MTSLLRGTSIVSALTVVSRLLGFVRDMLTAQLFGAGPIADAFFVAMRIPNLMRSFVAEGAMTSAFVPVFTDELAKGPSHARATTRSVSGLLLVISGILTLLGIIFAEEIVSIFAPGFGTATEQSLLCTNLTQVMLPFIMCITLIAMLNGALNACGIYGAAAMAQVWMNVVLIIGAALAFWVEPTTGIYFLAVSFVCGGVIGVLVQVPSLRRSGLSIVPHRPLLSPATKHMLILMAPALIGATIYQLQIFTNTLLASFLETGSVSWLFYADRLVQLPIGIYSIALASVLLPSLARAHSNRDESSFSRELTNSLRFTSFLLIPIAVGLGCLAEPLVSLLFERGKFGAYETAKTASAIQAYALGLWAISCHSMTVRGLIARKDTRLPTVIGAFTLLLTIVLSLIFMGAPDSSASGTIYSAVIFAQGYLGVSLNLGHVGLALAASISSFASFGLTALFLSRRISISWTPFYGATLRALIASMVMGLALYGLRQLGFSPLLNVLGGFTGGVSVYALCCVLLGSIEFREMREVILRQIKKIKKN